MIFEGYRVIGIFVILLLGLMVASLFFGKADLTIGGKNYTEQVILVHMVSDLIESHTGLKVRQRPFLGGTLVTFQALRQGSLDGYIEYTGTGLTVLLEREPLSDPDEVRLVVETEFKTLWDLEWLDALGFNNTYVMTINSKQAKELGVTKFSELEPFAAELTLGATHEFLERADGYPGLTRHYGFAFGKTRALDPGLTYQAAAVGKVDVIDAFATDGRIQAFDLHPLKDDKHYFPAYHGAPLFRADVLKKYPELKSVLRLLANRLDDAAMRSLNYEVDSKKRDPLLVAREWLTADGLL
ncbi:MAG: glycine/betaine ABC transporter substrate-binding protein [Firmicutes bacterium]|nr:glycine/betaine ABC transporter substrate-binding protein [Bacillota bacterium]